MNNIIRFVYMSQSHGLLSEAQVEEIVAVSEKNNKSNDITGMLFYKGGYFLQVLEGESINVYYTFKKIRDDKRHHTIKLLDSDVINNRIFNNWSMAYKPSSAFSGSQIVEIEKIWAHPTNNNFDLLARLGKFYLDQGK